MARGKKLVMRPAYRMQVERDRTKYHRADGWEEEDMSQKRIGKWVVNTEYLVEQLDEEFIGLMERYHETPDQDAEEKVILEYMGDALEKLRKEIGDG